MELHIYGALYTALFVVLCIMFIGTFEEKRKYYFKWNQFFIFVSMIIVDYFISVVLDNNIVLKEVIIILAGTFFMYLYFQQKYIKTAVFVLSYQGICFMSDYITILLMSKCFPVISIGNLSEPLINLALGILSQMLIVCFIILLRRFVVKKSSEMLTTIEWMRFTIFPVYTIIVLIALLKNFEIPGNFHQKNLLLGIAFGLLIIGVFHECITE